MSKQRVLSGIRASGRLHLGNYLGAVKGMLELQNNPQYQTFYMVADAHAITTPYEVEKLRQNRREIIIDYLAAGLDPQKSVLFCQSEVTEHFELSFYFSAVTTVARMQHLPTFKDKVKQQPEQASMALLNYPILQAADILLYQANLVPVGKDQEPHLEVAREIARHMNQRFGLEFPEPQRFATSTTSVPSLTGEGKMSKSITGSYINLTDDTATVKKKIRSIPTATQVGGKITGGLQALFTLAQMYLPEKTVQQYHRQFKDGTLKYVEIKDRVAAAISEDLQDFQTKRAELVNDSKYVDKVMTQGAQKAQKVAEQTMQNVRQAVGLRK